MPKSVRSSSMRSCVGVRFELLYETPSSRDPKVKRKDKTSTGSICSYTTLSAFLSQIEQNHSQQDTDPNTSTTDSTPAHCSPVAET